MPSNYPTGLDSFTTGTLTGVVSGSDHGNKGDALNKIEAELGISPSGAASTVATRLAGLPVNVNDYAPVAGDSGTSAKAANVTAFNAAIAAANTAKSVVVVPPGTFYFTAAATLTTLAGAAGMVGTPGQTMLEFSTNGNCLVTKGTFKVLDGIYAINRSATHSGVDAVIRIKNCAYGSFRNLYAAVGTAGTPRSIMLEHEYDGSSEDAAFIAHLGCWYNEFSNINAGYLVVAENIGYGISFEVNSNAVSVVNPPGQTPGTYTGSVSHNTVNGMNVEGKSRGVNLDRALFNSFIGGQHLGSANQVYGRNGSSHNRFIAQRHNQWDTAPFDVDSSCVGTQIVMPSLFDVSGSPWSLGSIGSQPVVLAHDDAITEHGLTLRDLRISRKAANEVHFAGPGTTMDFVRPDGTATAVRLGNGTHGFYGNVDVNNASGTNTFVKLDGTNGCIDLKEAGTPGSPAADHGRLFVKDNGAGKSQLCVLFASGAVQVISTEP